MRLVRDSPGADSHRVLVSSISAGEGKSTIAWHLAASFATFSPTLLIECDLRKPSLATRHGLQGAPGLVELISGRVDRTAAIQKIGIPRDDGDGLTSTLDVIVAGETTSDSTSLLDGSDFQALLGELSASHKVIVLDVAPVEAVADAIHLADLCTQTVLVARWGRTSRKQAARMKAELRADGIEPVGVVANMFPDDSVQARYFESASA